MIARVVLFLLVLAGQAQAEIFYISPTGSNANNGTSSSTPFLTFAYALDATRASCGDTLIVMDGVYGDGGPSTGKLSITNRVCTLGNELIIQAQNQRQAKIVDSGTGKAVNIVDSAHITIDGLYAVSTDNSGQTAQGTPFFTNRNNHITLKNLVGKNPNRYANVHMFAIENSTDVLIEDSEAYVFHRHCVEMWQSTRVTARRVYCNPRGGKIPGGFGLAEDAVGTGGAAVSMYPCQNCIAENVIADGTTHKMFLNEMNATYGASILMSGSKVIGSICYKCNTGHGLYINSRNNPGLNYTPQFITVRDVALVDQDTYGYAVRVSDGVNITLDHISGLSVSGVGDVQNGIHTDNNLGPGGIPRGSTPAENSITMTNILMRGYDDVGFNIAGFNTWSGDEVWSHLNGSNFSPSLPSNWTNTSTADPGIGTCKVWIPAGAAVKGAGTGGSDIGATILYRYVDGVLTDVPLWDPITGAFPRGAADRDNTNRVVGESLFDFHARINVNSNGCVFPPGYGSSAPTNPSNVVATDDTSGAHVHVITSGMDSLTVAVMVRWDGAPSSPAAEPLSLTSSCGSQDIPGLVPTWGTPATDRTQRIFGKISPNAGTCTLTPTFTNGNVSGWVMISVTEDNVINYGDVSAASGLSDSPASTVIVNATDSILGFVATSKVPSLAAGLDQTLWTDRAHPTKVLRGALSWQAGGDGNITYVLGGGYGWISQNVVLVHAGGGGSGSTFRISRYRIDGLFGQEADPEVTLGALASQDTAANVGLSGAFRLRAEIIVEVAPSTTTGTSLYCRNNGIPVDYARIHNTFGANVVRMYGSGSGEHLPVHGQLTTRRFSGGAFQSGHVWRDDAATMTLNSIPVDTMTEVEYLLVLGNGVGANDLIECQIRTDNGVILGTHTVLPSVRAVTESAAMGF